MIRRIQNSYDKKSFNNIVFLYEGDLLRYNASIINYV